MQEQNALPRVAVIGASGYSGIELTKILARHPGIRLGAVASARLLGETVESVLGISGAAGRLRYVSPEQAQGQAAGFDLVFLATPAEVSAALAPALVNASVRVVDLSGAFRLSNASLRAEIYGLSSVANDLQSTAIYGVPELFRDAVRGARFVASAGCYATAAALAVGPVVRAGLVADGPVIIDALSGTTGAGRSGKEELSFSEVAESARAYRVLSHQHTPEIEQTLARLGAADPKVLFTPHLVPMRRGILATGYVPLRGGVVPAQVHAAYAHNYAYSPFVTIRSSPNDVAVANVAHTNRCDIGFAVDARTSMLVVVSALDNLRKGAASQAVQNMNLALGLEETAGLVEGGAS